MQPTNGRTAQRKSERVPTDEEILRQAAPRSRYATNEQLDLLGINQCGNLSQYRGNLTMQTEVDPSRRKLGRIYPDRLVLNDGTTIMRPEESQQTTVTDQVSPTENSSTDDVATMERDCFMEQP